MQPSKNLIFHWLKGVVVKFKQFQRRDFFKYESVYIIEKKIWNLNKKICNKTSQTTILFNNAYKSKIKRFYMEDVIKNGIRKCYFPVSMQATIIGKKQKKLKVNTRGKEIGRPPWRILNTAEKEQLCHLENVRKNPLSARRSTATSTLLFYPYPEETEIETKFRFNLINALEPLPQTKLASLILLLILSIKHIVSFRFRRMCIIQFSRRR